MAGNELFVFKPGDIVRRPNYIFPWGDPLNENNFTWWQLKARKISNQSTSGRGGTLVTGDAGATFIFLSPQDFGETINHEWAEYESMASRLANKARDAAKLGGEIQSLFGAKGNIGSAFKSAANNPARAAETLTRAAYNSVAGHNIPKIKIDTPLYYQSSRRREITLEFTIVAEGYDSIKNDVLDVVQDLMRYSSPGISSRSAIDIEFPYYFELKTLPNEGFKFTTAALTSVQPTYGGPWIKGFPSTCKMSLTFRDISPLFRKTITHGSIINVVGVDNVEPGRITANETTAASSKTITQGEKQSSSNSAGIQRNRRGGR